MLESHIYSDDLTGCVWLRSRSASAPERVPHNQDDGVVIFASTIGVQGALVIGTRHAVRVFIQSGISCEWSQLHCRRANGHLFSCISVARMGALLIGTESGQLIVVGKSGEHVYDAGMKSAIHFICECDGGMDEKYIVGGKSPLPHLIGPSDPFRARTHHRLPSYYALTCGIICTSDMCIITGDVHGKMIFWSIGNGEQIASIYAHSGQITNLVGVDHLSSSKPLSVEIVCSSSTDWKLHLWCTHTRNCLHTFDVTSANVYAIHLSGQNLNVAVSGKLVEWDITSGRMTSDIKCEDGTRTLEIICSEHRRKVRRRENKRDGHAKYKKNT